MSQISALALTCDLGVYRDGIWGLQPPVPYENREIGGFFAVLSLTFGTDEPWRPPISDQRMASQLAEAFLRV